MFVKYKVITIDGPAGTGKSTIAKRLAKVIGFAYFDTGALYRAITWKMIEEGVSIDQHKMLDDMLINFSFEIKNGAYFVNNEDVTHAIRSKEVTDLVSEVSTLSKIRKVLKPFQLAIANKMDVIVEGRDLGTVVFPDADIKFFLTARLEIRARRRFKEIQKKHPSQLISYTKIFQNIKYRDHVDSKRNIAPLKQASDAILIDTSDLTIEQVIQEMKKIYTQRLEQ